MILKLLVPQQELHFFLKTTQMNFIKLLSLKLCKVSAVGSTANSLRTGQEMLALNIQEVIRKKSKLASGKTFLGLRNTSSECPGPVVSLGQAGEGCSRKYPPSSSSESGNAFLSSGGHLLACPWRTFCIIYISTCSATGGSRAASSSLGWPSCRVPPVPRQRTVHRTDNRASTSVMPGTPHSYTGTAEILLPSRTGLNISHRRFLLQSSCQQVQ